MSFRTTVCPNCHKTIQVPTDLATPACPYCGEAVLSEGPAPAATASALMVLARTALTASNWAEATSYFNRVLESDPTNSEAWIGKGKAAGWASSLASLRFAETLVAFNHAIATVPDEDKGAVVQQVVQETNSLVAALYGVARGHLMEFVSLDGSWAAYLNQVSEMLLALDEAAQWDSSNRITFDNIIHLCKDNIEGVSYRDKFDNNLPKLWSLSPQYESALKARIESATSALRLIDPTYAPPIVDKKTVDACFVVTATMGDFDHPYVSFLREFRGAWLLQQPWGSPVVRTYYRVGPHLASWIEGDPIKRALSLCLVVRPAVWLAKLLYKYPD